MASMTNPPGALNDDWVIVRGAGELASGVAFKLARCGIKVLLTEIEHPLAIRRGVSFAEAVYRGVHNVEGIQAQLIKSVGAIQPGLKGESIPILVDPELKVVSTLLKTPHTIIVDARMLKVPLRECYPFPASVIGLGPGFRAPEEVRFVIETNRGHQLGRVIEQGNAEPNTAIPAEIEGISKGRALYAPQCGRFEGAKNIGDLIRTGDIIGHVDGSPVIATLRGILRGVLHDGTLVTEQVKVADIDPREEPTSCFRISDKARCIAGGVLEAVLRIRKG